MAREHYKDVNVRVRTVMKRTGALVRFAPMVHVRIIRMHSKPSEAFEAYRLRFKHERPGRQEERIEHSSVK
jgi:hypothetical protein